MTKFIFLSQNSIPSQFSFILISFIYFKSNHTRSIKNSPRNILLFSPIIFQDCFHRARQDSRIPQGRLQNPGILLYCSRSRTVTRRRIKRNSDLSRSAFTSACFLCAPSPRGNKTKGEKR